MAVQIESIGFDDRAVGDLTVDPNEIRGSGGGLGAMVTVPLRFALRTRPMTAQLAIVGARAELWLRSSGAPEVRIGFPAVLAWASEPLLSFDNYPSDRHVDVSFDLTREHVRLIEASTEQTEYLPLELRVGVDLARVTGGSTPRGAEDTGWIYRYVRPDRAITVRLHVERSRWADHVLPAVGADRVRLASIRLGDARAGRRVVAAYDAARHEYDNGRYRECLQKCRDVRHEVEQLLRASGQQGQHVPDRVAQAGLMRADSTQSRFLEAIWSALAGLTSDAHHIKELEFTARDARAGLLITAVLVEFVSELDPLRASS